jgi:hypothetical protein
MLLQRAIESRYRDTVSARRVTVVTGPRQSGKTTLVRTQLSGAGTLRSLDDQGALVRRGGPAGRLRLMCDGPWGLHCCCAVRLALHPHRVVLRAGVRFFGGAWQLIGL